MNNAAVIVLYNPDKELLYENVKAIIEQVDFLIFVDNSPFVSKLDFMDQYGSKKYTYIFMDGNKGIGEALNTAVNVCLEKEIPWLLTLDQDSICPNNLISSYQKYVDMDNIGIICCNKNYNGHGADRYEKEIEVVNTCITSASYINTVACRDIGLFDEKMFIDYVDFEYCYRLLENGYKIIQVNTVTLVHRLGDLRIINLFGFAIHVENHNSFRKYYIARNIIYTWNKHPVLFNRKQMISKEMKLIIKVLLFEKQKKNKLRAICKGIRDALLIIEGGR